MGDEQTFWDAVEAIRAVDPRFGREAYAFVVGALGATVQALPPERLADPERRHLGGRELIEGMLHLARAEFGPMAPMVFREWGVRSSEDIGTIVFQLVGSGQLSARPEDSPEDFRGGPDLLAALEADPQSWPPLSPTPRGERPGRPA